MRVLITRPLADAGVTAALLEARGDTPVVEPLLEILPLPTPPVSWPGIQAVLITSANGIRALAEREKRRDVPVLAVGDASAREASLLGFTDVRSASGDVQTLARLVVTTLSPAEGRLLQVAANVERGDLATRLMQDGFEVEKVRLYESRRVTALSASLVEGLKTARIDAAVFFSPRTARSFVNLAEAAGVLGDLQSVAAYALSPAVADEMREVGWRILRIAREPNQEALLALLDEDRRI